MAAGWFGRLLMKWMLRRVPCEMSSEGKDVNSLQTFREIGTLEMEKEFEPTRTEVQENQSNEHPQDQYPENKPKLNLAPIINMKMKARAVRQRIAYNRASHRVIWPDSKEKLCWDSFNFCLLVYSVFDIPYSLAFSSSPCEVSWQSDFNLFVDCFFLCDFVVNFFTAYMDDDIGSMIADYKRIAIHYAKSWLVFDLLSSLPLDRMMCDVLPGDNSQGFVGFVKAVRLVKVVRFLRMLRIGKILEEKIGSVAINSIRILKFVSFLLFCTHLAACIWHGVIDLNNCEIPLTDSPSGSVICGCLVSKCQLWNWLVKYDASLFHNGTSASQYLVSAYYAVVTLTTLGYGDVVPTNDMERAVSSALALSGGILFSFLISSISRLVAKENIIDVTINEIIAQFSDLCRLKSLPRQVLDQSRRQISNMITKSPALVERICYLPRALQSEVVDFLTVDTIGSLPLFADMDRDCRARLAEVLRPCVFYPGASIFEALNTSTEFYWLTKGDVDLYDVGGKRVHRSKPGEMIGIAELFPENPPFRLCSARARTRCELLEMRKADFVEIVEPYMPDLYKVMRAYAAQKVGLANMEHVREAAGRLSDQRCASLQGLVDKHARTHHTISSTFAKTLEQKISVVASKPYMVSPPATPSSAPGAEQFRAPAGRLDSLGSCSNDPSTMTAPAATAATSGGFDMKASDLHLPDSPSACWTSISGSPASSSPPYSQPHSARRTGPDEPCRLSAGGAAGTATPFGGAAAGRGGGNLVGRLLEDIRHALDEVQEVRAGQARIAAAQAEIMEEVAALRDGADAVVALLVRLQRERPRRARAGRAWRPGPGSDGGGGGVGGGVVLGAREI